MDELLDPDTVSKMLGVKESTIKKWLRYGYLPGIKTGKAWRIKKVDVQELLEKGLTINKIGKLEKDLPTVKEIILKNLDREVVSNATITCFAISILETIRYKEITVSEVEEIVSRGIERMKTEGLL